MSKDRQAFDHVSGWARFVDRELHFGRHLPRERLEALAIAPVDAATQVKLHVHSRGTGAPDGVLDPPAGSDRLGEPVELQWSSWKLEGRDFARQREHVVQHHAAHTETLRVACGDEWAAHGDETGVASGVGLDRRGEVALEPSLGGAVLLAAVEVFEVDGVGDAEPSRGLSSDRIAAASEVEKVGGFCYRRFEESLGRAKKRASPERGTRTGDT